MNDPILEELVQRFKEYSAIDTESDTTQKTVPSTAGQWTLAKLLLEQLNRMDLNDVHLDENCVLTAHLPGSGAPVGFVAHLDTANVGLSGKVRCSEHLFDGDFDMGPGNRFRVSEHPEILPYMNERILFSDGTSVLGADNKAAVAVLMTMLNKMSRRTNRPNIYVAFVPDEEIGLRGSKLLNLSRLPVRFAYTIDSCEIGEVVLETFNAASATLHVHGVTAHPMNAKDVLVNPILVAMTIVSKLDQNAVPEKTEGREGYIWVNGIQGGVSECVLNLSIRDHDQRKFEDKKLLLTTAIQEAQELFPKAKVALELVDVYQNIADCSNADSLTSKLIYQALEKAGIQPKTISMRGGTDGSALSARGLYTPNYFTGALNFHSKYEFLPLSSFKKSFDVTWHIAEACQHVVAPGSV
ncbi:MAG: hypothetical protein KVP17_001142 [Porospora cf. gigantea B]|uniref:uncharacterized protein n=1 Tax=Porospora cf. gigantea B TaxID=2853592 RepID=UPI003571B0DA|nr:MAG: hypothetical protein KVP17_001142 [Porospora cf. gigantea B]